MLSLRDEETQERERVSLRVRDDETTRRRDDETTRRRDDETTRRRRRKHGVRGTGIRRTSQFPRTFSPKFDSISPANGSRAPKSSPKSDLSADGSMPWATTHGFRDPSPPREKGRVARRVDDMTPIIHKRALVSALGQRTGEGDAAPVLYYSTTRQRHAKTMPSPWAQCRGPRTRRGCTGVHYRSYIYIYEYQVYIRIGNTTGRTSAIGAQESDGPPRPALDERMALALRSSYRDMDYQPRILLQSHTF